MANFKRLARSDDHLVQIQVPLTPEQTKQRDIDYATMSNLQFNAKHHVILKHNAFTPVTFTYKGQKHLIQFNHCTNPFCHWYGNEQAELKRINVRGKKRYKYRLDGMPFIDGDRRVICKEDPLTPGASGGCGTRPISTWSVAEEINRLVTLNTVLDLVPDYIFHKLDCDFEGTTPLDNTKCFYPHGKSKTNSERFKCKSCGKVTNILPKRERAYSYHQKRNEILPTLAAMLINRVPVRRACEILNIGSQTYYDKMEYVYMRCLEFLEKHEEKPLYTKTFDNLWINSDIFVYYLNNNRHKFAGGSKTVRKEDFRKMQTRCIVSGDIHSRYIFRADLAYDWDITMEQLEKDTQTYKCDHMERSERKNARLEISYTPQPPTTFDELELATLAQVTHEYEGEKREINTRLDYVPGLHVSTNYTALAHFWLLRQELNVKEWYFVTDDDGSLKNSIFRAYKKEVADGYANYFLCKVGKEKSLSQAIREYADAQEKIRYWREDHGLPEISDYQVGIELLAEELKKSKLFDTATDSSGYKKTVRTDNFITHPLASHDIGYREIGILTDLSALDNNDLAKLLIQVNNRPTDTFMQQIRRRVSLLERPLVTARADKKSYIYSNYSPKYAQYLITILRTYYNFCSGKRLKDGQIITPAMRLGIAYKAYDWKDILYFK